MQVFNLDTKAKLKAHQMAENIEFWRWIGTSQLALVSANSVYHWSIEVRYGTVVNGMCRVSCPSGTVGWVRTDGRQARHSPVLSAIRRILRQAKGGWPH